MSGGGAPLTRRRADRATLRRRLDQAVADGGLPARTDTDALAVFFIAVLQGLAIQARDGANRQDLQRVIDHAMRVWNTVTTPN